MLLRSNSLKPTASSRRLSCWSSAWGEINSSQKIFERVASECVVLCGGNGTIVESDIERYYRDAKINAIAGMALPHLTDIVANAL